MGGLKAEWSRRAALRGLQAGLTAVVGTLALPARAQEPSSDKADDTSETSTAITAIGFSPDGRLVAAAGVNHVIGVWEVASGKLVKSLLYPETQNAAGALAFTDENRILVVGNAARRRNSKGVALLTFEIESGDRFNEASVAPDWAGVICANPKAGLIASIGRGSDRSIRLWDRSSLQIERIWPAHDSPVRALAMSQDGKRLLSGGGIARRIRDPSVRLWDLNGREIRKLDGHTTSLRAVAFTSDGRRIVSMSSDSVRVWSAETGAAVGEVKFAEPGLSDDEAVISPDGAWFASAARHDGSTSTVLAQRAVATGKILRQWTDEDQTTPVLAVSPDGRLLLIGGDGGKIRVWDAKTGLLRQMLELPAKP